MKLRIPDQAEKLRQLAAKESTDPLPGDTISTVVLDESIHDESGFDATGHEPPHQEESVFERVVLEPDVPEQSDFNEKISQDISLSDSTPIADSPLEDEILPQDRSIPSADADMTEPVSFPPEEKLSEEGSGEIVSRQAEQLAENPDLPIHIQDQQEDSSPAKREENSSSVQKSRGRLILTPKTLSLSDRPHPFSPRKEETRVVTPMMGQRRFPMNQNTQVIAITGGKGGVGKSNIACNLAIAMAQMNKQVLVLDADLSLANVDVLLGLSPRYNLSHVIRGEKEMKDIIVNGPEGVKIIPGGSGVEELSQLSPSEMHRLFDAFIGIQPVPDIFLIDTAAGIHPNVMQFLSSADQVIVVTTPEPTAYTDAYALIKTLIKHQAGKEIGLLVNMAQNAREAAEVLRLMLQMCRQFLNLSFNNIGFVPRDPDVLKAVRYQKPFILRTPNSPASTTIRNIAATILQIDLKNNPPTGLRKFFHRLFRQSTIPEPSPVQPVAVSE